VVVNIQFLLVNTLFFPGWSTITWICLKGPEKKREKNPQSWWINQQSPLNKPRKTNIAMESHHVYERQILKLNGPSTVYHRFFKTNPSSTPPKSCLTMLNPWLLVKYPQGKKKVIPNPIVRWFPLISSWWNPVSSVRGSVPVHFRPVTSWNGRVLISWRRRKIDGSLNTFFPGKRWCWARKMLLFGDLLGLHGEIRWLVNKLHWMVVISWFFDLFWMVLWKITCSVNVSNNPSMICIVWFYSCRTSNGKPQK
jgi:hypothetical protein